MLVTDPRHPELAAAAGPAAGIEVGIKEFLGAVDSASEKRRGDDPRQGGLVRHLVVVAASVDQICGPGGSYVRVVEALEDGLDFRREMLGVHPVDGVGERPQDAELAARG